MLGDGFKHTSLCFIPNHFGEDDVHGLTFLFQRHGGKPLFLNHA